MRRAPVHAAGADHGLEARDVRLGGDGACRQQGALGVSDALQGSFKGFIRVLLVFFRVLLGFY